jgi:predicted TIM-barrel fold metal-dependent hydrolase
VAVLAREQLFTEGGLMKIIDAHAHLGPWSPQYESFDAEQLIALEADAGIQTCVVSSTAAIWGSLTTGNEYVIREAEKHEGLYVWLVLNPLQMEKSLDLLERFAGHEKVVGIKLHPCRHAYSFHVSILGDLLMEIGNVDLPILTHCQRTGIACSGAEVREVAVQFPHINFVAAHYGIATTTPQDRVLAYLDREAVPNLYIDMAAKISLTGGYLPFVVRHIGADRILFGTDAPLYYPAAFTGILRTVNLSDEDRELIAHRNAERLLRLH